MNNIKKFCKTLNTKYLKLLTSEQSNFFKKVSFRVLFQKEGNQNIAIIVLKHFGLIKQLENDVIIYTGPDNFSDPFINLERKGAAIIKIIPENQMTNVRQEYKQTLREFPEYLRGENKDFDPKGNRIVYVLGGFAGLGNPASFHNEFVRKYRLKAWKIMQPLFKQIINTKFRDKGKWNLELLFGRIFYRFPSQKASAESWHRDVTPSNLLNNDDEVFGGWINMGQDNQYFSYIPGSHLGVKLTTLREGFADIPKKEIHLVKPYKKRICIPPGYLVIFPEYILHEVVSQTSKHVMLRQGIAWRITRSKKEMFPSKFDRMKTQDIMHVPSGQLPPMYSRNHGSCFLRKRFKPVPKIDRKASLIEWSLETMKPPTLVQKPSREGRPSYKVVDRYMHSLKHYNFPMYKSYSKEEKKYYKPIPIL